MYTVAQYVDELTEDEGYTEAFETFEEAEECFNELLQEGYEHYEGIKLSEHKVKFVDKNGEVYTYVELFKEPVDAVE